jgi:hypothetical protein
MRETTLLEELCKMMAKETDGRPPSSRDLNVFKEGNPYNAMWTSGHYQLAAPKAVAVKPRPAVFGIWDGKKFKPTPPIDISTVTEDGRLTVFNSIHPIGREVRYFIGNAEEEAAVLKPGQPYSVFLKKFVRSNESKAKVRDSAPPLRVEGPFINVQWTVVDGTGHPLVLTTTALVPEEIIIKDKKKIA